MAAKVKQIALKDLDAAILDSISAVNAGKGLKLKGPIIIGIVLRPDQLGGLKPEAVAKQITAGVAGSVGDVRLTPKVVLGDGILTMGYIMRELQPF